MTTTMTREQFEAHFAQNREIEYKGITIGIMEWGDGRYDVLTPDNSDIGYRTLNPTAYLKAREAVNFAIDYLLENEPDKKPKKKTSKKKKEEPIFNGPRTVRVFSRDIYIEDDINATFEDIRVKLVNEYDMPNFKKDKVSFDFDAASGILEVFLKFNQKG